MGWMTLFKVKAVPVQATTDNQHLKVVGLVLFSVTRLSRSQGHSTAERFKDKEKSSPRTTTNINSKLTTLQCGHLYTPSPSKKWVHTKLSQNYNGHQQGSFFSR